jgi:hypothetical protein
MTVTPTQTPQESISPLGLTTRLYTSPSPGDPGTPGPGGGDTSVRDSCGGGVTISEAVERSVYVSIQGLTGGLAPYTVDFSNVVFHSAGGETAFPGDPQTYSLPSSLSITKTYFGGSGITTNPVRTSVGVNVLTYTRFRLTIDNISVWWPTNQASYRGLYFTIHGKVIVTDQLGSVRTWWIPTTPTLAGGSNITTNPFSILFHTVTWDHYYTCSEFNCQPENGGDCVSDF